MDPTRVLASTGDQRIDDILHGLIGTYNSAFPERIRGYYLIGSYADGSAVPLSDIDLAIIFKKHLSDDERTRAVNLAQACLLMSSVRLDIGVRGEDALEDAIVLLKQGSLLVYGEDIRTDLTLPDLNLYRRETMAAGQRFLMRILRAVESLPYPLPYPDPTGEFYGYDAVRVPLWYPPGTAQGCKELVTAMSRLARGLLAVQTGRYSGTKQESIFLYRAEIRDEWTPYLEELYTQGKLRWGYLIPEAGDERALLRNLCHCTLAFENHFFAVYRTLLLELLRSENEESCCFALARLGEVLYRDEEVITAVSTLTLARAGTLSQAAHAALGCLKTPPED